MAISWLETWKRFWLGATEPVKDKLVSKTANAKFDVVDANNQLGEFRQKLASLMAQNDPKTGSLTKRLASAKANALKYGKLATTAVKADNDAAARVALSKKSRLDQQAAELQKVWDSNEALITKTREEVRQRQDLVNSAEDKIATFEVRSASNEIRKSLVDARTGLGASDAFSRLASLEDHYDEEEGKLTALETLAADVDEDALLASVEDTSEVDDALAALKANLGK